MVSQLFQAHSLQLAALCAEDGTLARERVGEALRLLRTVGAEMVRPVACSHYGFVSSISGLLAAD